MKSRVMVAEDLDFEFVQRFDDDGRENLHFVAYSAENFERVDYRRRGSPEQR